jgi:hypothetical protein
MVLVALIAASKGVLTFDHLVGKREQLVGDDQSFAVLRLMTNSNLVGCSTGKSDGFSPEDPSDVDADLAVRVRHAGSIANQPRQLQRIGGYCRSRGSRTTTALPSLLFFRECRRCRQAPWLAGQAALAKSPFPWIATTAFPWSETTVILTLPS